MLLAVNSYFDLRITFLVLLVQTYRRVLHEENICCIIQNFMKNFK